MSETVMDVVLLLRFRKRLMLQKEQGLAYSQFLPRAATKKRQKRLTGY